MSERLLIWFQTNKGRRAAALSVPAALIIALPTFAGLYVWEHQRNERVTREVNVRATFLRDQMVASCERGNLLRLHLTTVERPLDTMYGKALSESGPRSREASWLRDAISQLRSAGNLKQVECDKLIRFTR